MSLLNICSQIKQLAPSGIDLSEAVACPLQATMSLLGAEIDPLHADSNDANAAKKVCVLGKVLQHTRTLRYYVAWYMRSMCSI